MLHETIRADLATAVPSLTDRQIGKIADALTSHMVTDFAAQIRADAKQIERDVAAGRLIMTEHGYFTPEQFAQAKQVDGGTMYPSYSSGVSL